MTEQARMQNSFHVILRRYLKIPERLFRDVCGQELKNFKHLESKATPAETIIYIYNELKKSAVLSPKNKIDFSVKRMETNNKVINFFIKSTEKYMSEYVERAYIHGSYATDDPLPNWSDLDTLFFLKEKVFLSVESLLDFKKKCQKVSLLLYKIDPLAHHELMFFTEFDRLHYPAYLFPPTLFEYSRTILGDENFEIITREEFDERIDPMRKFLESFKKKIALGKVSQDDYSWKNDLSLMMLFPSLLLESKGIEVYKKFSFDRAKSEFPNLDFSVIDEASDIREKWHSKNFLRFYPNFLMIFLPISINRKVISLHRRFFASKKITGDERSKRLSMYKRFVILAESAIHEISK